MPAFSVAVGSAHAHLFVFVPVAGFEPARIGSTIELHGMLLTSTMVQSFALAPVPSPEEHGRTGCSRSVFNSLSAGTPCGFRVFVST